MVSRIGVQLIALSAAALFIAACVGVTAPTPEPAPAQIAEAVEQEEQQSVLLDTAWTVVSFGGPESSIPVVPDSFPTVNYLGTRYAGYGGCNFYLGVYGIEEETLGMKTPAVTRGFCDNQLLLDQEEIFLTALTAISRYAIDGEELILYVGDEQAMVLEALDPVPLEGTTWGFKFLGTDQAVWLPIIPGTSITAQFEGDTIAGSAGCNDYTATITRDGNSMTVGDTAVTAKMCIEPDGVMEQEQRYLEALQRTGSIREYARSFELFDAEKRPLMLFTAE